MRTARILLFSFVVPLTAPHWEKLDYSKIPKHSVTFESGKLEITVKESAGPLIHRFDAPKMIKKITFKARLTGGLTTKGKLLGSQKADDFPLRIGLIIEGEKRLSFLQRLSAPEWVRRLFELAPKNRGVDHVYFLNVTDANKPEFSRRIHPLSDLLVEEVVGTFEAGVVSVVHELPTTKAVLGLWLSSDGDDTKSSYKITVESIEISL